MHSFADEYNRPDERGERRLLKLDAIVLLTRKPPLRPTEQGYFYSRDLSDDHGYARVLSATNESAYTAIGVLFLLIVAESIFVSDRDKSMD